MICHSKLVRPGCKKTSITVTGSIPFFKDSGERAGEKRHPLAFFEEPYFGSQKRDHR